MAPQSKPQRRKSIVATISPDDRVGLYAARRRLPMSLKDACKLRLPFVAYFQDPIFAKANPALEFDEQLLVDWEPGFEDGPTSARFAVVDFNGDTGELAPPAQWKDAEHSFCTPDGKPTGKRVQTLQFHQVNVWALLQRALQFFEEGNGLGRPVPWAFEGNRLIVVPHAGYGENAFYDRESKSLQFYYFGSEPNLVYTCLSADIVNHEFGHAVLDGVRPLFNESLSVQTAAFHESMGDLTAILLALRNNAFRQFLADKTAGKLAAADALSSIAEQFGKEMSGRPYLRTAVNEDTMPQLKNETSHHRLSCVLTGAMYQILIAVGELYQAQPTDQVAATGGAGKGAIQKKAATPKQAFWRAIERMQRMTIQPLDLLPPVEVNFRDYAVAVCRAEQLANPLDPLHYFDLLIKVFRARGILSAEDEKQLKQPQYLYDRKRFAVPFRIEDISRSKAGAYRFLDDNREDLLIPAKQDFFVSDLYDANKLTREGARLPRQIILEYAWREDVLLEGPRFGQFAGQTTTMLCGGTLVFDDNGIVLSWAYKPGSLPYEGKRARSGAVAALWDAAVAEGRKRRETLLDSLEAQIAAGRIGSLIGGERGLLGSHIRPLVAAANDGTVQFRLAPHLHLSEDDHLEEEGRRLWEISS